MPSSPQGRVPLPHPPHLGLGLTPLRHHEGVGLSGTTRSRPEPTPCPRPHAPAAVYVTPRCAAAPANGSPRGGLILAGVFFFAPFEARPVLLSPEKVSREKRFEQLLASLERNKETNKTKRNKRGKKEKKIKKKKTPNRTIHVLMPVFRMDGVVFFFPLVSY